MSNVGNTLIKLGKNEVKLGTTCKIRVKLYQAREN